MSQSGDPFFDALRELQPDVDVVVLPPEEPPPAMPVATEADAAAVARGTGRTVGALLAETGVDDAVTYPRRTFDRWERVAADVHVHRTRARIELPDGESALDALLRARDVLRDGGWEPRDVDSPTPWIVATSPQGESVEIVAEGHHLLVTVFSLPLRVEGELR